MRKMRLELTREVISHKNLNLARLPIPTLPLKCSRRDLNPHERNAH